MAMRGRRTLVCWLLFRFNYLFAPVESVRRNMMSAMGFARGRVYGQGGLAERIVGTPTAPPCSGAFAFLNGHFASRLQISILFKLLQDAEGIGFAILIGVSLATVRRVTEPWSQLAGIVFA